jgi:membrane protein YqaA with SNARE-associated domain
MTGNSVATTFRGWLNSALRWLVVVGVLAASLLPLPAPPFVPPALRGG